MLNVTTGAWSTFGGPFAAAWPGYVSISRSGRYAALEYDRDAVATGSDGMAIAQAVLVDLTGADLPGAQEPLSASSCLPVTPPVSNA